MTPESPLDQVPLVADLRPKHQNRPESLGPPDRLSICFLRCYLVFCLEVIGGGRPFFPILRTTASSQRSGA